MHPMTASEPAGNCVTGTAVTRLMSQNITARRITESGTNKTTAVAISYQIRKGSGSIPLPKYLRSIC